MSLDNCPDEEGDTSRGHEVRFDGEQMADFVHRKPDSWQAAGPEEEKAEKVPRNRS